MRLIDSDLFKENIRSGLYVFCQENKEDICNAIDDEPTVEERPQGEWIVDDLHNTICNKCGGIRRDNRVEYIAFCNKCGADMRGNKE